MRQSYLDDYLLPRTVQIVDCVTQKSTSRLRKRDIRRSNQHWPRCGILSPTFLLRIVLGALSPQGFRVELDGVSAAMQSHTGVTSACALLIDGELYGFYAPTSVLASAVLQATMALQPCYAVPSRYIAMEALPLTG